MSTAQRIAASIARNVDLRKVIAIDPVTKELYGYAHFVVNQRVLSRMISSHWKVQDASLDDRVEAFNLAFDIVESRIEAAQAAQAA